MPLPVCIIHVLKMNYPSLTVPCEAVLFHSPGLPLGYFAFIYIPIIFRTLLFFCAIGVSSCQMHTLPKMNMLLAFV